MRSFTEKQLTSHWKITKFVRISNCNSYKINHHFSVVNFRNKEVCVQLQKTFTNKRLCHGNNLLIANIFMDYFERKYIHQHWESLSLSYWRFIYDIFFTWTRSKDQLITFLNNLSKKLNSIKFHIKDITIKYSFTWHGCLYQKQQTIP